MIAKACHLLDHELQAVLVSEGARCEMLNCIASGSVGSPAIRVTGERSRLHIQDSQLQNNALGCLLVEAGGMADVEGCFLEDSRAGPGCKLRGAGTQAILTGCALTGNGGAGLEVCEGARAKLMDCQLGMNDHHNSMSEIRATAWPDDPPRGGMSNGQKEEDVPSEGKRAAESASDPASSGVTASLGSGSQGGQGAESMSSPSSSLLRGDVVVWGVGSQVLIGDGVAAGLSGVPGSGMVAGDGGELVYEESLVPQWRDFSCLSSAMTDMAVGSNASDAHGGSAYSCVTPCSTLTNVLGSSDSVALGSRSGIVSAGGCCALSGPEFMRLVAQDP